MLVSDFELSALEASCLEVSCFEGSDFELSALLSGLELSALLRVEDSAEDSVLIKFFFEISTNFGIYTEQQNITNEVAATTAKDKATALPKPVP